MCAQDTRPKTRLIFYRMITEDTHCDMLSKIGVSNIRVGDNEQLYAPLYPGRCPSDMSVPVRQKVLMSMAHAEAGRPRIARYHPTKTP